MKDNNYKGIKLNNILSEEDLISTNRAELFKKMTEEMEEMEEMEVQKIDSILNEDK